MGIPELTDAEALRESCSAVIEESKREGHFQVWLENLEEFLDWFQSAKEAQRSSEEFQRRLWDENPVSAIGQGNINVDPFLKDESLRKWLAHELGRNYPESERERRAQIVHLFDQIEEKIFSLFSRKPYLKLYRIMAASFPHDFTTIAHGAKLLKLHHAMSLPEESRTIRCHFAVMDRLTEVLGPSNDNQTAVAERLILPWLLYDHVVVAAEDAPTEKGAGEGGETQLCPLPAARRRRGLTAMRGSFQTILGILEFVGEGVSREELIDHLRTMLSGNRDSSLGVVINALIGEFGVLRRDNDEYRLTKRGVAFLETGDGSELADWLLTRILGVDAALVALRDEGKMANSDLIARIKLANPGWTSDYAPAAMASWLRALGYIEQTEAGNITLSELGEELAARIHWIPERLKPEVEGPVIEKTQQGGDEKTISVERPTVNKVIDRINSINYRFPDEVIRDLHAGLWANERRHFAVLTGLSGTGKTLLAKAYGRALIDTEIGHDPVEVVPVHPGWYDPGALFGYVNPLRPDTYVRTRFIEFVLKAVEYPAIPHTVVLDEMNLSHPEQYLAPILSAMEGDGGRIVFHREGDEFDGIPDSIDYPSNLVLIGTINMDETTHGLSDKLLDRAFTQEFWDVDVNAYPRWDQLHLSNPETQKIRDILGELYVALRPARMHFGWRTVDYIAGFLNASGSEQKSSDVSAVLDSVVYAKVLPKLRGDDSPRFRKALEELVVVLERNDLYRSRERVEELKEDLDLLGTARFWR